MFLLVAWGATAVFAVVPSGFEKELNSELKKSKSDKQVEYSLLSLSEKYKLNGYFYEINGVPSFRYAYLGRVFTNRNGHSVSSGNEYIDYLMLYDNEFTVKKVKVLNFKGSTGQGICAAGWLRQFTGHKPGKLLQVGKEIDAISGATSTVNTFSFDIQSKTNILYEIRKSK